MIGVHKKRRIILEAIEDECKRLNLKPDKILVGSYGDVAVELLKHKNIALTPQNFNKKMREIIDTSGSYGEGILCVFFHQDSGIDFTSNDLSHRMFVAYHELAHCYHEDNPILIHDIELAILERDRKWYRENHDNFFIEIDADYLALQLMKKRVKEHKYRGLRVLKRDEESVSRKANNYDFDFIISKFEKLVRSDNTIIADNQKLQIFYNLDGTRKKLDDIVMDSSLDDVDPITKNFLLANWVDNNNYENDLVLFEPVVSGAVTNVKYLKNRQKKAFRK